MADISKAELRKEIADILDDADLATTSAKNVRQELEKKLGANFQSRKKEIDLMVMEFVNSKNKKSATKKKPAASDDDEEDEDEDGKGDDDEDEEDEEDEVEEEEESEEDSRTKNKRSATSKKPAAKKAKADSDESEMSEPSDGDSEEEYSPKKSTKPPKTRKLAPKKKKSSDSDSDEDWGKKKGGKKGGATKRAASGYTKKLNLSPELAAIMGETAMPRHEVVKKCWTIIKERNLFDPKNKQFVICDDAMLKVFGVKRFRAFGMMKFLKHHFMT